MTSLFNENIQSLEAIYPGQAHLVREHSAQPECSPFTEAVLDHHVQTEMDQCWNPRIEFQIVYQFAGSSLAKTLFNRLQMTSLKQERNWRLLLIEDRLDAVCNTFQKEDWRTLIESERCLFAIGHPVEPLIKKLLRRYTDIANTIPLIYAGQPDCKDHQKKALHHLFSLYYNAIQTLSKTILLNKKHTPKRETIQSIRFFSAGHNFLQDASIKALRTMGCEAERLQWKTPLYRFVRDTAWIREYQNHPFEAAFFLNTTPARFCAQSPILEAPLKRLSWFVDNPRRYVNQASDFKACDGIGVFDSSYIPYIKERIHVPVIEVKTAFGVDPSQAVHQDEFAHIDLAFVGELGTRGFESLEKGFLQVQPELVETANALLRNVDITHPLSIAPFAEQAFALHDWPYQGALVEYLENKATAMRRRYYLEACADMGLVIFGDTEWRDDPSAGSLQACYGGRRLDYQTELPALYASAKININIFHVQCVSSLNPRVYDVLACGGFLLTSDSPALKDEFEPDKDLVVFHSPEELVEKAHYYLAHPDERKEIAQHGQKRALASCGYHDRMQQFLSLLSQSPGEGYVYLCR